MQLDKIKFTDINPTEYNPRKIKDTELSKLSKSIQDFGLVDPIIINLRNNNIIGGHQRYKVLLDKYTSNKEYNDLHILRLGDIGWVFPTDDLKIESEEHEKTLNILLNQTNLMGEWDNEKLKSVLHDLNDVDFDLTLTGFEDHELELYLDDEYETFEYSFIDTSSQEHDDDYDDDDEDELPSDYMDVQGTNAKKSYVLSIGFNDQETANKFLDYIDYPRHMNRDTLQFMFTELKWDLDELLKQKELEQEEQELPLDEEDEEQL